jgi:glycosyltransferase involved in cell wall biosynthesis
LIADNVTLHMMVRDENPSVFYALMSVLPFVQHVLIVDTGSTDGTAEILRAIKAAFPEKNIVLNEFQLPDSTKWSCNKRIDGNQKLAHCRKWMVEQTKTKLIWLVDGDEVYRDDGAAAVAHQCLSWPSGVYCYYIPLIWFAIDRCQLVTKCNPATYPYTGRLFIREGLSVTGLFPGELHTYKDTIIAVGMRGTELLEISPIHHLEMVQKPWRRQLFETKLYEGQQPEVFERYAHSDEEDSNRHSDNGNGEVGVAGASQPVYA